MTVMVKVLLVVAMTVSAVLPLRVAGVKRSDGTYVG